MLRYCTSLVLLVMAGCTIHSTYEDQVAQLGPSGIEATLTTNDDRELIGEVLAVAPRHLVLRVTAAKPYDRPVIARIAYAAIRRGRFAGARSLNLSSRHWVPNDRWRDELRIRSRFPQGLTPDVMDRLLQLHDQEEVIAIS